MLLEELELSETDAEVEGRDLVNEHLFECFCVANDDLVFILKQAKECLRAMITLAEAREQGHLSIQFAV